MVLTGNIYLNVKIISTVSVTALLPFGKSVYYLKLDAINQNVN